MNISLSSRDPHVSGGYPKFSDGDVQILTGSGPSWKLHSKELINASRHFITLLTEETARKVTKKDQEEGKTVKWRLEMIPLASSPQDTRFRTISLIPKSGKSQLNFGAILENIQDNAAGGTINLPYHRNYDNFFRCLYNIPPIFSDEREDKAAYFILDAISLLSCAEQLAAVKVVRVVIEAHLLRLNQVLWHHIEHSSESWAEIGVRLESPIIFREAVIHLVGRFDLRSGVKKATLLKSDVGKVIYDICKSKSIALHAQKLLVERRLLEFYPYNMVHKDTSQEIAGRSVYSADIYLWQALTIVRQFIASSYMSNMHHRSADGGINFYRCIGTGGDMYIRAETLEAFHQPFGMSTKGKQCLKVAVEFVKDQLKPIVAELLADFTQVHRGDVEVGLPYLTCTKIEDDELPWIAVTKAREVRKRKELEAVARAKAKAEMAVGGMEEERMGKEIEEKPDISMHSGDE